MTRAEVEKRNTRRYMVKGYASGPAWSGCTWVHVCTTLEAAEKCFARKTSDFESRLANADAILLIDCEDHKILKSLGTDDPAKVPNWYGWYG